MKLAFPTKFHKNKSLDEFLNMADELKYGGIEIHDFRDPMFSGRTSPFNPDMASSTKESSLTQKRASFA